uniref:Uncharacterized protein n=1 Tax=Arundo donax TaxID=35708 RepID=A0A0A9H1Y6_ARUDO
MRPEASTREKSSPPAARSRTKWTFLRVARISRSRTTWRWRRRRRMAASRSMATGRRPSSQPPARGLGKDLMATERPVRRSRARYTLADAPRPSRPTSSYLPRSTVPAATSSPAPAAADGTEPVAVGIVAAASARPAPS